MLCLLIELCLLSLTCLLIIRLVGMEIKGTNLSLLVIIVVLLVILVLTAFKYALKSHGLKSMFLGKMSLVLEIRSTIYVIVGTVSGTVTCCLVIRCLP
jgi:hypothetical protein